MRIHVQRNSMAELNCCEGERWEVAHRLVSCAQAAVVACQLVVHARRTADMGFLPAAGFEAAVKQHAMPLPYLPALGAETVLLRSGYQVRGCCWLFLNLCLACKPARWQGIDCCSKRPCRV